MFWSWRSVFWSWRVLVLIFVTCHVRSVTSELDPERWSSGWQFALWLTDSSLCAPGYWARSVRPPTLTPSSEEFWGNLCTVSWLIELATSCRQCVHCGCRTMLGFMVQTPPPTTTPHPQQRHDDHGLFIVFQSATRLRLHHWTIINQLNRTGPGGSSHL